MNKKAALSDLAITLGVILAMAITVIVANLVWQEYKNELAEAIDLDDFPRVKSSIDKTTQAATFYDKIFLAFVIAVYIGTMILGFRLRTSPIFIMFIFIFLPILVLLAKIMKDTYTEFTGAEALQDAINASTLTWTNQIMNNLPVITIAFAIGLSIVLYVVRTMEAL